MKRTSQQATHDALNIAHAGIKSVQGDSVVRGCVSLSGDGIRIGDDFFKFEMLDELLIVGGGKAGESMARALDSLLIAAIPRSLRVHGALNIPASDALPFGETEKLASGIELHACRKRGSNTPTMLAMEKTDDMLRLIAGAGPRTLTLVFISGGGSALLTSPSEGVDAEDKIRLTEFLARSGLDIQQVNTIRSCFSKCKAGGLARTQPSGFMRTIVLSDVIGDPLEFIASGPTVLSARPQFDVALRLLEQIDPTHQNIPTAMWRHLEEQASRTAQSRPSKELAHESGSANATVKKDSIDVLPNGACEHGVLVAGNLASAIDASGVRATELGYDYWLGLQRESESVERAATRFADRICQMVEDRSSGRGPDLVIDGGEPTVEVTNQRPGRGGRNQHLCLLVLCELLNRDKLDVLQNAAFLSIGTDGEDGPTEAAGAMLNQHVVQQFVKRELNPNHFASTFDAYHFFEQCDSLIVTGPTNTNVCDLRIGVSLK